jgi:hypothetical protein
MGSTEGAEFTLPSIPYFYHDIVARIIPGVIQLGLIAALMTHYLQSTEWVQKLHLKAVLNVSQLAALLMLLAAAYFVGVFFEGLTRLRVPIFRKYIFGLYYPAFKSVLKSQHKNIPDTDRLAEEASSILESYEPLVPHFFARSTRFNAEAKMMLYSALAMPVAVVVVWVTTKHWPVGFTGFIGGVLMFLLLLKIAFARERRRAIEVLRCVQYLARRTDLADAHARALEAWEEMAPAAADIACPKTNPPAQ